MSHVVRKLPPELLPEAHGFFVAVVCKPGLACLAGEQTQVAVGEGQAIPVSGLLRILPGEPFLNPNGLPIGRLGLGGAHRTAFEQADGVVAQGKIGPRSICVRLTIHQSAEDLSRGLVGIQRLGAVAEHFGDRPDLGIGDGHVAMEAGVVAGVLDELPVITQRLLENPLPEPLRPGQPGKPFGIQHAKIVEDQPCLPEMKFRAPAVLLRLLYARASSCWLAFRAFEFARITSNVLTVSPIRATAANAAIDRTMAL